MVTQPAHLTETEAREAREYVEADLDPTEKDRLIEAGLTAFANGATSSEAAALACMPRAPFLQLLIDKGMPILDGPSDVVETVEALARELGDERLAAAAGRQRARRPHR
jgi:hypothetical protein